jgi:NAD(P)-dependent dehydrogenase (short-subunit alcohol dehydrogenase family)
VSWSAQSVGTVSGQTFVITGANSGVGLEAARLLAAAGADIVMACRDAQRAAPAREVVAAGATGKITTAALDLADLDTVEPFVAGLPEHIDVLICNAGVMGGKHAVTEQGYERQMGTNHLGHAALVAAAWPRVTRRVVMLSSIAARGGKLSASTTAADLVDPTPYVSQQVYSNTKQANLLFAQELARRSSDGVRVVACHPGVSATELFMRQLVDDGHGWLVPIARPLMKIGFQSAVAGALPTVRAAVDPDVTSGSFVGPRHLNQMRGAPELLDVYPGGADVEAAATLWSLTEEILALKLPG